MKLKDTEDDNSESKGDAIQSLTEINDEEEKELEKVSEALRAKIPAMKKGRKKNAKKTFRSDAMFLVDVDVKLNAPGLKALLSMDSDGDDSKVKEPDAVVESQPLEGSQTISWDW